MIPKKIHYCWFGGNPLPLQAKRCLASWAHYLPDYQIVRWDESSFDIDGHPFTQKAYQARKYAFVADYVRMHVLNQQGGIYMDVDVHVCASFDPLLQEDFFIGLEDCQRFGTCVVGSQAGHWLAQRMLDYYDAANFNEQQLSALVNVNEVSRLLLEHGFTGQGEQERHEREVILRIGTFADAQSKRLPNVKPLARHLYAGSWKQRGKKSALSKFWRKLKKSPDIVMSLTFLAYFAITDVYCQLKRIASPQHR
jgi:hypothetical protein